MKSISALSGSRLRTQDQIVTTNGREKKDRKRAAPFLREWRKRVRHHVMAGYLLPIDEMVALELFELSERRSRYVLRRPQAHSRNNRFESENR